MIYETNVNEKEGKNRTHVYIGFDEFGDDIEGDATDFLSVIIEKVTKPQRELYDVCKKVNDELTKKILKNKKTEHFYVETLSTPFENLTDEERKEVSRRFEELKKNCKFLDFDLLYEREDPYGKNTYEEFLKQYLQLRRQDNSLANCYRQYKFLQNISPSGQRDAELNEMYDRAIYMDDVSLHLVVSREDFFDEEKQQKFKRMCQDHLVKTFIDDVTLFTNIVGRDVNAPENYTFTSDEIQQMTDFEKESGRTLRIKEGLLLNNDAVRQVGEEDDDDYVYTSNSKYSDYSDSDTKGLREDSFTIEQVKHANAQIDKVVKTIKENDFSPLEAMEYIHLYITNNFEYQYGANQENIMGGYSQDPSQYSFVCAGYSSLTRAIIDRLGDDRLKCDLLNLGVGVENGLHTRCLIQIKDEKYGIDGKYTNDACWDRKQAALPSGFANFLRPISDMDVALIDEKGMPLVDGRNGRPLVDANGMPLYKYHMSSQGDKDKAHALLRSRAIRTYDEKFVENSSEADFTEYDKLESEFQQLFSEGIPCFAEILQDNSKPIELAQISTSLRAVLKKTEAPENVESRYSEIFARSFYDAFKESIIKDVQGTFQKNLKEHPQVFPAQDFDAIKDALYSHSPVNRSKNDVT